MAGDGDRRRKRTRVSCSCEVSAFVSSNADGRLLLLFHRISSIRQTHGRNRRYNIILL